jgi:hypothetical protein
MAPAHQYFNTANAQGIGFDYRLIDNIELIVFIPSRMALRGSDFSVST